jgi:hypothetical protein
MGERPYDLHHSSVAAKGEDGVEVTRALMRYFGRVTGSLGQHDVARDSATGERRKGLRLAARASSRPRIDDE